MSVENNGNVYNGFGIVDAALGGDERVFYEMYEHLAQVGVDVEGGMRSTELIVVGAIMGARHSEASQTRMQQAA